MDSKLIARMMEFCREHHLCIGMNIGKYGCYVNKEVLIEHEKRIFGDGDREYIDESNLLTHPFYGLAYFGDPKGTDLLREAFPEIKTPLLPTAEGQMSSQKKFPRQMASRHFWTITRKTGLTSWHLETA